jgi:hypothetical protein
MQVNSLVVNQVSAIGGKEILSAASITCSRVETTEQGYKCYFDQKRGSVANLFVVNDIAYSQVFNANDVEVKHYKREVIEVGDNYILLSLDSGDDSNGAPQVGDVIAQYGNTDTENNANRQYVIIRDVIGGGYERMLSDLNSVNATGTEYYFAGRLDGDTPRWFVGNAEGDYAEWKDGTLSIKGKLAVGSDVGGATVVDGGLVTAETIALGGDEIKAGITGKDEGDDAVRIWAGNTEENKDNAPFRVMQDGRVVAENADIKGKIRATEGELEKVVVKGSIRSPFSAPITTDINYGDEITSIVVSPTDTDNFYNELYMDNSLDDITLTWDMSQSGRRMTMVGRIKSNVPDGVDLYFHENGIKTKTLIVRDEVVELIGFARDNEFKGWLVLNRKAYETNYSQGKTLSPLAIGKVKYSTSTNPSQECYACDGSALSVVRTKEGTYSLDVSSLAKITKNGVTYNRISKFLVFANITPSIDQSTISAVSIASLIDEANCKIEFRAWNSNGDRKDTAFNFIIYPINTWAFE